MQAQIDNLQKQIDELKNQLTNNGMSIDLREIIRDEVIKDTRGGAATETYTLTGDPEDIIITKKPTTFIILKWKGREYNVPYYETI